jgi:hypothetical protein
MRDRSRWQRVCTNTFSFNISATRVVHRVNTSTTRVVHRVFVCQSLWMRECVVYWYSIQQPQFSNVTPTYGCYEIDTQRHCGDPHTNSVTSTPQYLGVYLSVDAHVQAHARSRHKNVKP